MGFLRSARNRLGNLIKRNEFSIRDYHVAALLVMTKGIILPRCARNDIEVYYFFFMVFPLEERDEELRLEDRLTLEEELFTLREVVILAEEPELLLEDTDLEGERDETDEELLEGLLLTTDLGAEDFDVLTLVELALLVALRWREGEDEEEREILLRAEGVSALDLEDFFKAEEIDGNELDFRLFDEALSRFNLDG